MKEKRYYSMSGMNVLLCAFVLLLFFSAQVFAQNMQGADEIVRLLDANRVYDTAISESLIRIESKLGITDNEMCSYMRKNGDTLIEIISGPDRGQKILRLSSAVYLYYPDAEEVIRLQGSALKESILGSDFSYEDLTGDTSIAGNYTAQLVGTELVEGRSCYKLVLTAKKKTAAYQKQDLYIDTELYVPLKTILYSASGKALREMIASDIREVNGHYIPHKTVMTDLLKKTSVTRMTLNTIDINMPLSNTYFTLDQLSW